MAAGAPHTSFFISSASPVGVALASLTMRIIVTAGALLFVLTACGEGDGGAPSAACVDSMETAAGEPDLEASNQLIVDTLDTCGGVDEWIAAVEQHPGALGLTERAEISDLNVQAACFGNEDTKVCRDAADQGILNE